MIETLVRDLAEGATRVARGRYRYHLVPIYLITAIWLLSFWWQSALFLFLLAAALWHLAPRLGWASEYEWRALASGMSLGAVTLLITWPVRGMHSLGIELTRLVAIAGMQAPMAIAWWGSRRIRKVVSSGLPRIVELWRDEVIPRMPQLRGQFDLRTWDPDANTIELHLETTRASHVARLAGEVEALIDGKNGSVRLRSVDGASVRRLLVQYVPDPTLLERRVNYARDARIDSKGLLYMGDTSDGTPWHLPVRRKSGAAHISVTGTTGAGKGVTVRRIVAAYSASPWVFTCVIDLKGGTGVPSLALGSEIFACTKEEILLATEIMRDLRRERMRRYAELKRGMWHPDMDPMLATVVDEIQQINQPQNAWLRTLGGHITDSAAQGRSNGCQITVTAQRNDGESMISPTTRSNLMGGGTALMHKPGDTSAGHLGAQNFDVDPSRIPGRAGWCFALCNVDKEMAEAPILVAMTPDKDEVRFGGMDAPFGTIEEWLERDHVTPELVETEALIAGRWTSAPAPMVDPASLNPPGKELEVVHQFEKGAGGGHESAGHARAQPPPPPPSPSTHRESMIEVFRKTGGEPIRRGSIIAGITTWQPGTKDSSKIAAVTDLLTDLHQAELIERVTDHPDGPGFWRWLGASE